MFLPNYEYFIAIVESGSLTKAAEKLFVSQPSLSQYLKRLERNLGVELFDHSSSPLRLTFTGERYYQYVLQLQRMDEDIRREFLDIKNEERGRLRLGIALWRGACLLPKVFPYFHEKYPGIRLELFEGRSSQLENALIHDKIDMAVMNLPIALNYRNLTCETIFEEPILLAAPTSHPDVQQLLKQCSHKDGYPTAPIDLVCKIPLTITLPGQNLTYAVHHVLGKHHLEPDILLETSNLTTAVNLVAQGITCAFVPGEDADIHDLSQKVTYFMIDDPDLKWPLAAVYRKDSYLPRIARLFIAVLHELLGERNPAARFYDISDFKQ